jgi:hypothetical protein
MRAIISLLYNLISILIITGFYKKIYIHKYFNHKLFKTCFPDDNENIPIKSNINYNLDYNYINNDDDDKPLYTLIWYDCENCKKLLQHMEELNLKKLYINGGYYFYDISNSEGDFNDPLLYKDDELIGDNLFDIYSEIYKSD